MRRVKLYDYKINLSKNLRDDDDISKCFDSLK